MKNTVQITIGVESEQLREELVAQLSALDFNGFEEKETELLAFIDEKDFDATELENVLQSYQLNYAKSLIEEQNWNAVWESNFQPVIVDHFCAIRAEFHQPFANIEHEIVITPKMSFGTGHHATTYMMIQEMSKLDFKEKTVADFGTGTGVLAILAEKLGSRKVWAIDNDEWSITNSIENIERNGCKNITIEKVDSFSPPEKFDIIVANINKSVILGNVDGLLFGLKDNGELLLSGLLKDDEEDILAAFINKGLIYITTVERNNWICLLLRYKIKF